MTMTREERIAHANEIFARVWPENGTEDAYDGFDVARCDLIGWIEELEDDESTVSRHDVAKALREIADRLDLALEMLSDAERAA